MQTQRGTSTTTLAEINALIETLEDPTHRRMLENVRDHFWAEVIWDVPAIMKTFSPTGTIVHQFRGGHYMGVDGYASVGRDVVQTFYEQARDEKVTIGPMEEMKWTFGPSGTNIEALFYFVVPGKLLPNYTEPLEENQLYLVSVYQSVFFPFEDPYEYSLGETIYAADQPVSVEPIDEADVPAIIGQ